MQQLTEASNHAGGDPVPCHLFMPDVAWPPVIGPVLRPERARYCQWLQQPVTPWRPGIPQPEREQPAPVGHVTHRMILAGVVGFLVAVGMLVQAARSEAAVVSPVAAVLAANAAANASRAALANKKTAKTEPAPVVVSPSLAKPPVRCERDGLGQCVGGAK